MSDEYQLRKDIDELQRDSARLNNTLDEANVLIDDLKDIDKKFDNYYDSSVIDELLSNVEGGNVDLSSYPTKDELNNILSSYAVSSNYYTKDESDDRFSLKNHTHSQYLTSHQSLTDYVKKSSTKGLLKNDGSVDTNSYLTSHQSLSNYYSKSESDNRFAGKEHSHSQYLTEHQSLTDYLTESEINQLLSSYVLSSALNNYYTKTEADNRYRKTSDNVDARDVEYTAVAGQTRLLPSILDDLSLNIGNNTKNITQLTKSLDNKADKTHTHNISDVTNLQSNLDNKVDKVTGKGLSSNDYTTIEKNKLAGVETGATKTIIDSALSSTSTNPVQNKVINNEFNNIYVKFKDYNVFSLEYGQIPPEWDDDYSLKNLYIYVDNDNNVIKFYKWVAESQEGLMGINYDFKVISVIPFGDFVNDNDDETVSVPKELSTILTYIDTYYIQM